MDIIAMVVGYVAIGYWLTIFYYYCYTRFAVARNLKKAKRVAIDEIIK